MKKIIAIYQIIIGLGMIGIWILLFLSNQIPEIQTELIRITMHILAEITTGVLLISSGVYILTKKKFSSLFDISSVTEQQHPYRRMLYEVCLKSIGGKCYG